MNILDKFENNIKIDLIVYIKEKYDHNSALFKIILSNIKDDLERREFTINVLVYYIIGNKIL